jgi:uncharacterized protein YecT (DUF1311 family)
MTIHGLAVCALLGTGVSFALVNAAEAVATASFDCAQASTPIEKLICSNDDLAALDAALGQAYGARRQGLSRDEAAALRRDQREWLHDRLGACDVPGALDASSPDETVPCLLDLYRERMLALGGTVPGPRDARPAAVAGAPPLSADLSRGEKVFTVDRAGRFAVRVESQVGAALEVIDRMAGPSPVAGEPGKKDGRLDLLLDRGSYKAAMFTPEGSSDHASLRVDPFRELSDAAPPVLVELKPVVSDLDDLTQRSWWLDVPKRRSVALEAAGRYLADLRLWKDGSWLVDAAPAEAIVEPEPGRPLSVRRLVATLEPGLYLVTAYGGPGAAWATGANAKPLYLRFGIPTLAEAARTRQLASPFGVDRFLVPKPANRFRLQLDAPSTAALTVSPYNHANPFATGGSRGEIAKKSRVRVVELALSSGSDFALVTVERQPGQPYQLQNFFSAGVFSFHGSGDYWVDVIHDATSDDDADITGVLTETGPGHERVIRASTIELGPGKAWSRRFNLLDRLTLYLSVTGAGNYLAAAGDNVEAEFRFEPVGPRPNNYRTPDFERGDHVWTLESGIYLLTVQPRPEKTGIATLSVRSAEVVGDIAPAPRLPVVGWRSQALSDRSDYRLYLNQVPGISAGLVLRQLPIDIGSDLPMTLKPQESVDIPITVPADGVGVLAAAAEDGNPVPIALDAALPAPSAPATAGPHRVVLANNGDQLLALTLRLTRDALQPEAPPPGLAADRLKALPNFPVLAPDTPAFLEVARDEQRSFNIAVTAPALYRLETGGLLRTQGNLRTRMVTSLSRADANGVGRNFLIQNYLREGDYQLSLKPGGASTGHLSLRLTAAPIEARGVLTPGIPSRATLTLGGAVRYEFRIERKATYRLSAMGMERQFAMRVEDDDGWPVAEAISNAPMERVFLPGRYRATVLPAVVDARSVTMLEEIKPPVEFKGHGPHDLVLGDAASNEWIEPADGGERLPDRWRFHLPAPADAVIAIGDGMIGALLREQNGSDTEVARLLRAPDWKGALDAGDYRLELAAIRPNNHLPYTLSVRTEQLLVGQSRSVSAPATLAISLGGNDLVDISSFGSADVRARLYDADDHLIAANDDRADDWNFDIAATLTPGRYRLRVEPVGATKASTRIDLFRPQETGEKPLAVPGAAAVSDAALHTYPLTLPAQAGLLVVAAQSREAVSVSLERPGDGAAWRTLDIASGQAPLIAVPVAAGDSGRYRLRVWSTDRKPAAIELAARLVAPRPASEAEFKNGIAFARIDGIEPPAWAAAVAPADPGVFQLAGAGDTLRWSTAGGVAAAGDPSGLVIAGAEPVWLVDRGIGAPKVSAARLGFEGEIRLVLPPGQATITLPPAKAGAGPVLWLAQSRFGQPGIVAGDIGTAPAAMGIAENSSVTLDPGAKGDGKLRLWNASDTRQTLQFTLRQVAFAAPTPTNTPPGARDATLGPQSARMFGLGAGSKRLHLLLPPQTAAVLRQGETVLTTLWADRVSQSYTAELAADTLLLLHAGENEAHARVTWSALDAAPSPTLGLGRLFKRYDGAAGVLRLDVAVPMALNLASPYKLRIHGNPAEASFVARDGGVQRGSELTIGSPGTLFINHGPGLVAAWLEQAQAFDEAVALDLGRSARVVKLTGATMRFAVTPAAPSLLSLRTTAPVIASIIGPDGRGTTEAFAGGGRVARYLPAGRTLIELQSAAEGDLAGDAEFVETPVTPIDEGLGEAVQLGAGETRLYGFTLAKPQTIGVGLRASVDIAQCRLLDAGGKTLGSGIVQMHKLPAGTFLLAVEVPVGVSPIEIRPALVGVHEPDPGPPDEIKRHYLQLVGRLPSE